MKILHRLGFALLFGFLFLMIVPWMFLVGFLYGGIIWILTGKKTPNDYVEDYFHFLNSIEDKFKKLIKP